MNIIFSTICKIENIQERGIYTDLIRKFKSEGHNLKNMVDLIKKKKELYVQYQRN